MRPTRTPSIQERFGYSRMWPMEALSVREEVEPMLRPQLHSQEQFSRTHFRIITTPQPDPLRARGFSILLLQEHTPTTGAVGGAMTILVTTLQLREMVMATVIRLATMPSGGAVIRELQETRIPSSGPTHPQLLATMHMADSQAGIMTLEQAAVIQSMFLMMIIMQTRLAV